MSKNKRNERSFMSVEEELAYLRRQNAGQKGMNASLTQKLTKLVESKVELQNAMVELERISESLKCNNKGLVETVRALNDELSVLKANVEYYNGLPWYERFFKKIVMY